MSDIDEYIKNLQKDQILQPKEEKPLLNRITDYIPSIFVKNEDRKEFNCINCLKTIPRSKFDTKRGLCRKCLDVKFMNEFRSVRTKLY